MLPGEAMMLRPVSMAWVLAILAGTMFAAGQPLRATDIKDPTEIIRSLAPIEYLPVHSGLHRRLSVDLTIPFALDSAEILPDARMQLQALGEALASEKLKSQQIEIAGHTDASGTANYNRRLSKRRAEAVAKFLVDSFGFRAERFYTIGHGEDELKNPLLPRSSANRRVEISSIRSGIMTTPKNFFSMSWQSPKLKSAFGIRTSPTSEKALRNKVKREGNVRVIVSLQAVDEQLKADGDWQNINDHIRELQDRALNRLGWKNFNDLVRFNYTPAMAMSVDSRRLDELLESNAVTEVYEDGWNTAFLNQSTAIIGVASGKQGLNYGKDVSVAVLDTGVDRNHVFLGDRVVGEACFSTNGQTENTQFYSTCPNGEMEQIGISAAQPCPLELGCFHGTHVAGIAAGAGKEFAGVAAAADIVAVQVFTIVEGGECGELGVCAIALDSNILRGLEWIFENRHRYRIAAINLSVGNGSFVGRCDYLPLGRILLLLRQANIVTVGAAGNSGMENSMASPACSSDVVSVGATTDVDNVADFSNSSIVLDFFAPGTTEQPIGRNKGILSSIPGDMFVRIEGTSMAAPHVTGAIAALKSAVPQATSDEMIDALRLTGHRVFDGRNGRSTERISVDRAIEKLRETIDAKPSLSGFQSTAQPKAETRAEEKPNPQTEAKPAPEPETSPIKEDIDGIRIERGPAKIGEGGKIEW
tara:strand:- start:1427 stop:3529 length:2103 start_codon:yes stop_codon:yes gene_type:complete